MAHSMENPIDADMFSNLHNDSELQTTGSAGSKKTASIRKCIHPPSAVPNFEGLPTNDARSQVCLEWRNMELMGAPRFFNAVTQQIVQASAADLQTFDYALLIPNGARIKSVGFIINPTNNDLMLQDFNGMMLEQLYNFQNWQKDANLYRPTYKSTTLYLNATAFNNTGMVVGNQFNPNILFAGSLINFSAQSPRQFYQFVAQMHKLGRYRKVDRPSREQTLNWEEFPHYHRQELARTTGISPTEILELDPNTSIQVINLGNSSSPSPVPSTSQILGNSLRSLGCKATEGMFSVQRLNTITPQWLAGANTNNQAAGLYESYTYTVDAIGQPHFVPLFENVSVGGGTDDFVVCRDTLWSKDMTWSWVRFSGLSLNSQTSVSTQLLIKKVYTGLEVQPCPTSSWAGMMKLGPKPDLEAMQATMDAFYELKDVMPARYNFWGVLGTLAAQGAATFGSALLNKLIAEFTKPKAKPDMHQRSYPTLRSPRKTIVMPPNETVNRQPAAPRAKTSKKKTNRTAVQQLSKQMARTKLNKRK